MKRFVMCMAILVMMFVSGCTDNARTKFYGGEMKVDLPIGQKLVEITWKEGDMWYLTRPMRETETAEVFSFQEKSGFGLLEGTVTVTEHK